MKYVLENSKLCRWEYNPVTGYSVLFAVDNRKTAATKELVFTGTLHRISNKRLSQIMKRCHYM